MLNKLIFSENIKKKWYNLRAYYLSLKNKLRKSAKSGAGTEDLFKPNWHLFEKMGFISKTIDPTPSVSNLIDESCTVISVSIFVLSIYNTCFAGPL